MFDRFEFFNLPGIGIQIMYPLVACLWLCATRSRIIERQLPLTENNKQRYSFVLRLDYLSCVLTITSTILVGRRCWEGWIVATVNSVIMCIIGVKTAQLGFIPANVFCIAISVNNLRSWRRRDMVSS